MRYYDIVLSSSGTGSVPSSFVPTPNTMTWSSHPWGGNRADPGAQQIEMRLELGSWSADAPSENSTLVIKGVSWQQISQQTDLVGLQITIYGGMHPGLPLATFQSRSPLPGRLVSGTILKAWGNWIRDDMAIGMNIGVGGPTESTFGNTSGSTSGSSSGNSSGNSAAGTSLSMDRAQRLRLRSTGPRSMRRHRFATGFATGADGLHRPTLFDDGGDGGGGGSGGFDLSGLGTDIGGLLNMVGGGGNGLTNPLNLIHNMMQGMPLSAAIQQTLSTAFPGMNLNVNISSLLQLNYQDAGVYQNMTQYAQYIRKLSQSILGVTNYPGVRMFSDGKTITVTDFTGSITTGQIAPADLIGQPTWINKEEMHFSTVLRSDIKPGMDISLPPNILMTLKPDVNPAGSGSPQRTNISFQGTWHVYKVHHVGDFRNPDGAFWSSNFECGRG